MASWNKASGNTDREPPFQLAITLFPSQGYLHQGFLGVYETGAHKYFME
jgi:hypothetical protein